MPKVDSKALAVALVQKMTARAYELRNKEKLTPEELKELARYRHTQAILRRTKV